MQQTAPKTRLEFLMKLTSVTGKTLSGSLHVDMSLVSRWKSGIRKINSNSDQLDKICEFFISNNEGAFLPIIHQLIYGDNSLKAIINEEICRDQLKRDLSQWLLEPIRLSEYFLLEQKDVTHLGKVHERFYVSFSGNEGRRKAMLTLLDYMSDLEQPRQLRIVSGENFEWLREDSGFYDVWKYKMLQILKLGHQIFIIRRINRQLDELLKEMIEWMPLYLTGQVFEYVEPNIEHIEHCHSFFVVEDAYVLSGFSMGHQPNDRFTALTNDPLTIQSLQNLFDKVLPLCRPLMEVYDKTTLRVAAESIVSAGENNDNSYFMANELFFTNMTKTLLSDILEDNGCKPHQASATLSFLELLIKNFGKNILTFENHHIYNYQSLEKCAQQPRYLNSHLSILTGRPIYMTRQHFIRHIEGTIERLKMHADFEVALTPSIHKATLLDDLDIWIKDGHYLCVWSNATYEQMIISTDASVTHVFTRYYQQVWNNIPLVERDKGAVINKFNKLLKLARSLESLTSTE